MQILQLVIDLHSCCIFNIDAAIQILNIKNVICVILKTNFDEMSNIVGQEVMLFTSIPKFESNKSQQDMFLLETMQL